MNKRSILGTLLATALLLVQGTSYARWMNPNTGRFQTMDTFEGNSDDPSSLHKYFYAANNPVDNIDPSGHDIGEMLTVMDISSMFFAQISPVTSHAAASALPWKTLTLDTVIFYFSDFDEAKVQHYLARANEIYTQARIRIEKGKSETWDYDKTFERTRGIFTADYFQRNSRNQVIAGDNISSITSGQNRNRITAYFTSPFQMPSDYSGPSVVGMAFYYAGHFGSPPAPAVFISQHAAVETLAHEIGHILLDTSLHSSEVNNLMGEGRGTELTSAQIQVMRTHKLLQ